MTDTEKLSAISAVANGASISPAGKAKYRVGNSKIHVRFCSSSAAASDKYKFNINPNTLSADYELWVCGSAETYYLIPVSVIRDIYDNPNTYEDRHHPGIMVVSVDAASHTVTYAAGGVRLSLSSYFRGRLENAT